ncbi:MAG: HlyD family efflux transporter periplasmic adaptor subunit [Gallionella sp.]|nr:HlyD family efflux transporter periplasmic adaptor subunit [Gallionella sp.]
MKITVQLRRRIVLSLIAVLVAWGLFLGFRPQPVEVDTGTAIRAPLRVTIEQEGRTRVVDRFMITAPVNGYARRIRLDVGDAVERGATLVELEPVRAEVLDVRRAAEARARAGSAEAGVSAALQRENAAASNAVLAQKELQRVRALRLSGYVSAAAEDRAVSETDRRFAELRSATASVAVARHEFEAARTPLKYAASGGTAEPVVIRTPVAGRVLRIPRKSEGPVAVGQPLIEIGDPAALEVEVDVLSADAVRIRPGTLVVFERWGGEGTLEGSVRVVEPAGFTKVSALGVEEQRVRLIVAFTSPAVRWQRLGDGYRVEASIILWAADDVLQIPVGALFRDGNGWAAFALEKGKAVKRRVETGRRSGLEVQVISGIKAGELVIVHPDDRVTDGTRVSARK